MRGHLCDSKAFLFSNVCQLLFCVTGKYAVRSVIDDRCDFVNSTSRSLMFSWQPVRSAIIYRLVGHSMDKLYTTTEVTVDDLTPGSFYTFTVTAIGSGDLESNSVTCVGSTGESVEICSIVYINQINVIIRWPPAD